MDTSYLSVPTIFTHFFSDRLSGEDDVADVPLKPPSDSDISGAYRDQALGSSHPGPAHCPRYLFVSFSGCICSVASTTWSPTLREVPLGDSAEQQGPYVDRYNKLSQGLGMLKGAPVWTILVTMQYSSVLHHLRHPPGMVVWDTESYNILQLHRRGTGGRAGEEELSLHELTECVGELVEVMRLLRRSHLDLHEKVDWL